MIYLSRGTIPPEGQALPAMVAVRGRYPPKGVGMRSFTTLALVLLLCLALTTPTAVAAEPRSGGTRAGDFFPSFWSFLLSWWSPGNTSKAGCTIDPLGGCREEATTAPTTDSGCGIDPLGGCQEAAPTTEESCGIDPLG